MQQRLQIKTAVFFFFLEIFFIVPFLGPALGWTAMCSPGWGNLVAIDRNDLPVGREFDDLTANFWKMSNPHPMPCSRPPPRYNIDRCISISRSFRPFYDNLFQKISKGCRRFPKTVEDFRRLTNRSHHCRRCPKNAPNTWQYFLGNSKH